jgi:membrane-associated phospholipid phosphatase
MAVGLVTSARPLCAQSDTITPRPLFTWRDGVLAGAFAGMTVAVAPVDKLIAERLQQHNAQSNRFFKRASVAVRVLAFPGTVIIGASMYTVGRLANSHRAADLGLHGTEALAVGDGLAALMKVVVGRQRPYADTTFNPYNWQFMRGLTRDDSYHSFPSGHSVAAFSVAAAVTAETSRWWPSSRWLIGSAMYGGAGLVGVSRMYDNQHWASDVVVGAAIGIFAGNKVVRYQHSHPGNPLDRWLVNFSIVPSGHGHSIKASVLPWLGPR